MNFKILFFLLFVIISCKKENISKNLNVKKLTDLENYKIKKTKINDSIERIFGENSDFTITGNINTKNNKKDGWWKILNKKGDEKIEIEYLLIKPENFNQIKFYKNDKILDNLSCYYEIKNEDSQFVIKYYFPIEPNKNQSAQLHYLISDTINKKIVRDEKVKLEKKQNFYIAKIPLSKNENGILGRISEFTTSHYKKDSMKMEAQTIYFRN